MSKEIDLSKYNIRTDLIIDEVNTIKKDYIEIEEYEHDSITINKTKVKEDNQVKNKGTYITISFEDITYGDTVLYNVTADGVKGVILVK